MRANDLIGINVRSSTARDITTADRVIKEVHKNDEDGMWYAWSEDAEGHGEHLRANDQEGLVRRVMSLR